VLFTSKVALSKTSLDVMLTIKLILVLAELFAGFIIVILGLKASKDLIASKIFSFTASIYMLGIPQNGLLH